MLAPAFWQEWGASSLTQAVGQAIQAVGSPRTFAVALSGGPDSAMLAVHAACYARQKGLALHCFHIHHGLQAAADGWQSHAHDLALRLGVACHSLRVQVQGRAKKGMEAAARDARYHAFEALARHTGVEHVLLAHHRGDQAETVLLRLLRGAGPTGLGAMALVSERGGLAYVRPWLEVSRQEIIARAQAFAAQTGWKPVHDPTNADDQYTRAAVRERLAPELDARWPAWQSILVRHARQSRELAALMQEVAAQDLSGLDVDEQDGSFSLAAWRTLSPQRQGLVLRYWLSKAGLRMPSDARLAELLKQLRGLHALGHDRQMRMKHDHHWIVCMRGRVMVSPLVPKVDK